MENCHRYEWLECDGVIRFDFYWKRAAIGVRLAGCRIRDDVKSNEKKWISAGYFSTAHCPTVNYAAAKIFVSSLQIQSSLLCCFFHTSRLYMELASTRTFMIESHQAGFTLFQPSRLHFNQGIPNINTVYNPFFKYIWGK